MLHLQKFIDRLRGSEARGGKDFIMPMTEAKGLAADLTQLLIELKTYQEQSIASKEEQIIEVNINGGSFK